MVCALYVWVAHPTLAATQSEKNLTGVVTRLVGNQVIFKTANAVVYSAETSNAALVRKNGTPMRFAEFAIGDKVEVRGQVWPDNSMTTTRIRDLTLYVHNGTFTGKIIGLDPFSRLQSNLLVC